MLRRKTRIGTPEKINQTGVKFLVGVLGRTGLADLAGHFDLSAAAFLEAWDWDGADPEVSQILLRCVFETGEDAQCLALVERHAGAPAVLRRREATHLARVDPQAAARVIATLVAGLSRAGGARWHLVGALAGWRLTNLTEAQSTALWQRACNHPDLAPAQPRAGPGSGRAGPKSSIWRCTCARRRRRRRLRFLPSAACPASTPCSRPCS